MRRNLLRIALATAVALTLLTALVWPWPAPEIDWRTPVDRALAANDCDTAIAILSAAAGAGSPEAYAQARPLIEGGKCNGTETGERMGDYDGFVSLYRDNATLDGIYDVDKLSTPRRYIIAGALRLCAMPYNGAAGMDNAALAEVVPGDHGVVMAAHQTRRTLCLRLLEHMGGELVAAGDQAALPVAHTLLTYPPLARSHRAAVHYARLLLENDYSLRPGDEPFTKLARDTAWLRLERAAASGEIDAIRMMIEHLHQGRHRPRDDTAAYFWVLRLRKLGVDPGPQAREIEASLSQNDRDKILQREAEDRNQPTAPQ